MNIKKYKLIYFIIIMNIFALKVQAKASLPLSEIKKYKCLFKDNATQLLNAQGHYYFLTQHRPPIISTNIQDTICHDTLVYGMRIIIFTHDLMRKEHLSFGTPIA